MVSVASGMGNCTHDHKACFAMPRNRDIPLDTAAFVQHKTVDNAPIFDRNIIGGNTLQKRLGIFSFNHMFAEH